MAAPPAAAQIVSPFPTPPVYSREYTTENVANGTAPLPPCVQPDFTVFGEEYHLNEDIIRPLSETGIRQLYGNKKDWKAEMKKLNSSAVAAFVDLVQILISSPDHQERTNKLDDIRDIFINMHHLINEFRPVQARATLGLMQQRQLEALQKDVDDFETWLTTSTKAFRQKLKMEDVVRLPIPPIRPDLEGPDAAEEPKKKETTTGKRPEMATAMGGLSVGERKVLTAYTSVPRPVQQEHMLHKRRMDDALWRGLFVDGEKMDQT